MSAEPSQAEVPLAAVPQVHLDTGPLAFILKIRLVHISVLRKYSHWLKRGVSGKNGLHIFTELYLQTTKYKLLHIHWKICQMDCVYTNKAATKFFIHFQKLFQYLGGGNDYKQITYCELQIGKVVFSTICKI